MARDRQSILQWPCTQDLPTNDNRFITLPDGRSVTYAEYGTPGGFPVLFFHGAPSSRLEPLMLGGDAFGALGLHVIAPDRPGMGGSTYQPGRRFADYPQDVVDFAEAMELNRFAVLGNSGGCPYVLACAASIPERVHAAVVVSGAARMDWPEAAENLPRQLRLFWTIARRAPFLLPAFLLVMVKALDTASPERTLSQQKKTMPPSDYAVLSQPGHQEAFVATLKASMAQGTRGATWELRLHVDDWGLGLDRIGIPLHFFHGDQDPQAPLPALRRLVSSLPTARLVVYPGDAHLSTFANHIDEIAAALTGGTTNHADHASAKDSGSIQAVSDALP